MKVWLRRWGPAIGLMLVIFVFSSQPKTSVPEFGIWDWLIKKGSHLLGYTLLSLAMLRGVCGEAPVTPARLGWAWALTVLYAATDEYHQTFVPGRGGNVWDIGIDAVGATLGLMFRGWRLRLALQAVPSPTESEPRRR